MPSYKEDYPERWLKAHHLQGKDVPIVIAKVTREEVFDRQQNKFVHRYAAHFPGKTLLLLLNKTNLQTLEKITGSDQWDTWKEVRVLLSTRTTKVGEAVVISRAQQAQAQVDGAKTQVHGRPVHGPQSSPVHGLDSDEDFSRQVHGPVHGLPEDIPLDGVEEEDVPGEHYAKSAEPGQATGQDAAVQQQELFFSVTDLQGKVRSLNQEGGPMTPQQYAFTVRKLEEFSGKDADTIMSMLVGRSVDANNVASEKVGRYFYDLTRPDGPYPSETATFKEFVNLYLPKTKEKK